MTREALSTRERVRLAVSEHGPITAADLGRRLGLTPAAMRRHLDALVADDVIAEREAPAVGAKKRGRPARAYVLSERGHEMLPEGYASLANQIIEHLVAQAGTEALESIARERALELAHAVKPAVDAAGADPQARAQALADALSGQGFAASARPVAQGTPLAGVQLCQGHCPVQHVAQKHPQFCEAEAEAFSDVLGVHVQRLASLAHGDHVCTTFVPASNVPASIAVRNEPEAMGTHSRSAPGHVAHAGSEPYQHPPGHKSPHRSATNHSDQHGHTDQQGENPVADGQSEEKR